MDLDRLLHNRKPWLILLACLLFYGAQLSAQLHSIDHVFHKASEACSLYHSIEHHKFGVVHAPVTVQPGGDFERPCDTGYSDPGLHFNKSWYSRAPPLSVPV
jgi:hypothetical protein